MPLLSKPVATAMADSITVPGPSPDDAKILAANADLRARPTRQTKFQFTNGTLDLAHRHTLRVFRNPGKWSGNSGNPSGNRWKLSGKVSATFVQVISRNPSGNSWEINGKLSGNLSGNFLEILWKSTGNPMGNCSGNASGILLYLFRKTLYFMPFTSCMRFTKGFIRMMQGNLICSSPSLNPSGARLHPILDIPCVKT